jgi:hypothetical protein
VAHVEKRLRSATSQQHKYLSLDTTHFLVFGPRPLGESPAYTQSLLRMARGYDVETEHDLDQVVRKLGLGRAQDVLQVATLWSLSLGPGMCLQEAAPFFHLVCTTANRVSRDPHHALLHASGRHSWRSDRGRRPGWPMLLHSPSEAAW